MKPLSNIILLAVVFLVSTSASAQLTGADLKAKGTRMNKAEVETVVKGSTLRYTSAGGQPYQYVLNADGTFEGTTTTRQGRPSRTGHHGTWNVTDEGRFCRSDETKGQADDLCLQIWKLDGKYYYTNQSGRVTELEFSK